MTLYDVFTSRSQVFEYPNGPFEYLYCKYQGAKHIRITEDPSRNSARIPSVPAPTRSVFRTKNGVGALERPRLDPQTFVLGGEGSLFELRHFEEWRKSCFHGLLRLNAELFEALSAERAVFELPTVCLFGEPFSAVPTFHYCCNTHFSSFTSFLLIPFPSLLDEVEEYCSDYHYSLFTCNQ